MHGVKQSACSEQQEKEPEELPKEWRKKCFSYLLSHFNLVELQHVPYCIAECAWSLFLEITSYIWDFLVHSLFHRLAEPYFSDP